MDFHEGCFCFRPTEQVQAARQDGQPVRCAPDLGMPCACTASIMLNDFPVEDDPLFDVPPGLDWNSSSSPTQPLPILEQQGDTSDVQKAIKSSNPTKRHTSTTEPAAESPCCNCPCEKLHGYVVKRQKCCGDTCQCIDGTCNCPGDLSSGEKCCDEIDEFSSFLRTYGSRILPHANNPVLAEKPEAVEGSSDNVPVPRSSDAAACSSEDAMCSSKKDHSSCGPREPTIIPQESEPPPIITQESAPPPIISQESAAAFLQPNPSHPPVLFSVNRPTASASANTLLSLYPQHPILPIPVVPPLPQLGSTPILHPNGSSLPPPPYNLPTAPITNTLSLQSILRNAPPSSSSVTPGSNTASFPQSAGSDSLPVTTVFAMLNQYTSISKNANGNSKSKNISLSEKIELRETSTPKTNHMECTDCDAAFSTQDDLESHAAKKHRKNRPYACNQCGSTFLFKQNRDRHIVEVHHGKRPHKCPKPNCKAAFKNSSGLKQHMRTVHEKRRPFKCDQCSSSFGQRNHLTQHVLVVHEHRKLFQCDECGTSFSNRGNLNQHIRRRHPKVTAKTLETKKEVRPP